MVIDNKYSHRKEEGTHCWYCNREYSTSKSLYARPGTQLIRTVEHIVPFGSGGKNIARNKIGACNDCNTLKKSSSIMGFINVIKQLQAKRLHPMLKLFPTMINRCWKLYNKYDNKKDLKQKTFKA
jgi:hypothetical protein